MPSLKWMRPEGRPKIFSVYKAITSIGRASGVDVRVDDKALAEHHCQIVFDGKAFNLQEVDLDGDIQINGKKKRRQKLEHGDRILLGGKIDLSFSLFDESDVDEDDEETESPKGGGVAGLRQLHELSQLLMQKDKLSDQLEALLDAVIDSTHAAKGFLVRFEEGEPSDWKP